jgi:dipeptidyl aminopeptidase/acylaminoacyl peptidase
MAFCFAGMDCKAVILKVHVPIEQGYQLYTALKRQGVPTRMIILPRQPHGPNEPKMQMAAMQSNLEWFEKYLK